MMKIGTVILSGGKSRRMEGLDKALLQYQEETFLERIINEMSDYQEIMLSVDMPERYPEYVKYQIIDAYGACGPIGGLATALQNCCSDYLFVVTCDMPLFSKDLANYLETYLTTEYDVIIPVTRDGKRHPLCGLYKKAAWQLLAEQIKNGDYKLMNALKRLRVKEVSLSHSVYQDDVVCNVNTVAEYKCLLTKNDRKPVLAISGVKKSGKTTIITNIIPLLKEAGLKIAVIKHDGHEFEPDVPGTDSYRIRQSGPNGIAVFSSSRYMVIKESVKSDFGLLINQFKDVDLILIEGGKYTDYPKIEVVPGGDNEELLGKTGTHIAVCTDSGKSFGALHVFRMNQYREMCEFIITYFMLKSERGIT